ncbi:hypothetical protein TNCV_1889121 [Trichonephila clavipes]|nr:hypothetical protein TNCV_1889121 [Trichonephila clavipes]
MTPELAPPSPNYHTTPMGGRFSSRQIYCASLPYMARRKWYWARTCDKASHDPIPIPLGYRGHHSLDERWDLGKTSLHLTQPLIDVPGSGGKGPPNRKVGKLTNRRRDIHPICCKIDGKLPILLFVKKVNSFESLCDLIISDKLFETLNKETATHIGIREAEDWFRPIDLAKESDIYISSRSGSRKEIPITYGYTQDPLKIDHKTFKPKIKENYPQYLERENKNCFICGDSSHYARDLLYKKANGAMKTSSVEFISRSPNPLPMKSKHHRFVLLEGSSSPGSGNEGKREIVLNRRPELYRGKYRCVQPKINLLKRCSYAGETQCFPVELSGCRRDAFT